MRVAKRATISTTPSAPIAEPSVERPTVRCSRTGSAARSRETKLPPQRPVLRGCVPLHLPVAAPAVPMPCTAGAGPFPEMPAFDWNFTAAYVTSRKLTWDSFISLL